MFISRDTALYIVHLGGAPILTGSSFGTAMNSADKIADILPGTRRDTIV